MRKTLIRLGIAMFLLFLQVMPCFAKTEQSYVVDAEGDRQVIPLAYSVSKMMVSFSATPDTLSEPQDICTDTEDCLYILDSGNGRVIKISPEGELLKEICPKGKNALSDSRGIFVDEKGSIYIADTGNSRVVVMDQKGRVKYTLTQPDDPLYDTDYPFEPIKVGVNSLGQIYVINNRDYHGFCILNPDNEFKGYFAATRLEKNVLKEWISKFASESQKEQMGKTIPAQHTNFLIADDGSIYVTTANVDSAQMKRMSSVGNNFYPYTGSFGDNTIDYLMILQDKEDSEKNFVDVTVDDTGIVSILDNTTGRIYQYDDSGVMLFAFGGSGNWGGRMMDAAAMAQDSQKRIYVLDRASGSIQCFEPTDFTKTVHRALSLHNSGKYNEASELWKEILVTAPNYPPAHVGLGKTETKEKNYEAAMNDYKLAGDKTGYSDAFSKYLKEAIQNNFIKIVLVVIILIVTLIWLISELKRRADYAKRPDVMLHQGRHIALLSLFAPWDAFSLIKFDRKKFRWFAPTLILVLAVTFNVLRLFVLNYPFQNMKLEDISLLSQISGFIIPFFLWVFGFYYVSCIFGGEVRLREVYAATCYALMPYVVFTVPLALLTNLMGSGSYDYIQFATMVIWIWVVLLIFFGIKTMNHYTVVQTIGTMIVSVFAALLLAIVITLLYLLGIKLIDFVSEVISECKLYLI